MIENKSSGTNGDGQSAAPAIPSLIADRVFEASTLDEMEDVGNRMVSPHRIAPRVRGRHADAKFQFHGSKDLFSLNIRYGRELSLHHPDQADDRLAFVMATTGSCLFVQGREELDISGQRGVIFATGHNTFHFSEHSESAALILDRRKVAQYCAKLMGREFDGEISFETQARLDDPQGQSWLRLFRYATTELADPFSLVRTFESARQQLEQMMMTGLLLGQSHNFSAALLKPQSAAAPYYVKRAEAYIDANFAQPLSLADIAAHAQVSARSLQSGFQNFRGMTPMAFLRSVRLQHARQALFRADPAVFTVTQIALSCGFSHLGEFAVMYRRAFGETPRQTMLGNRA